VSDGPRPVLLNRTPYDKTHPRYVWIAEEMVRAGYIAVIQDTRGRYQSEGEWVWHLSPEGHRQEAEDGYDSCEWAAGLPGSDGQVGTWGNSYPAGCAWWMAGAQPPSLKAVFASGFPVSHRDSTYAVFETGQRLAWQHRMAVSSRRKAGDDTWPRTVAEAVHNWDLERGKWLWHLPLDTIPDRLWGPTAGPLRRYMADLAAEHWEASWHHEDIAVPTCSLTGLWDRLNECAEHFTEMRSRGPETTRDQHRLVIGPWVHDVEGEPDWVDPRGRGTGRDGGHLAHLLAWYDHHLRGVDSGLGDEPAVKLYIVNEGWRYFSDWPPVEATAESWFLHSGGRAATSGGDGGLDRGSPGVEPADPFVYDPADPVMSLYDGQLVACDQAPMADREDVLVFRSAPLSEDVVVAGRPEARIWLVSDCPDTDVFVRLIEESVDGMAINVCQGVVRARYREGYDSEVFMQPGVATELVVPLLATGFRFVAGSRIRVDVTSSDFPAFDRNHNTGAPYHSDPELRVASQTVFHDQDHPSRVILPILPT
ncbi:MAG TPA: CocE/NonD family hydrolase, partial [Acidimicrobiia bacterium]|nr:CocE/NonD family hydrolase [Acidimicrobiia bacterium]